MKLEEDTKQDIRELYEDGITMRTISWYLGIPYHQVSYLLIPGRKEKIIAAAKEWAKNNPEKIREVRRRSQAKYRERNRERALEQQRKYYAENRVAILQWQKEYRQRNIEKIKASERARWQKKKQEREEEKRRAAARKPELERRLKEILIKQRNER